MEKAIIALVGVVCGFFLTFAKEIWKDYIEKEKRCQYLTIRISFILDRYSDRCSDVAHDNGSYRGQFDQNGEAHIQVPIPELGFESVDVDWKALEPTLMYEILSLPNDAEKADQKISSVFEHASDPPEYWAGFEERQYQYAVLGLRAADLANKLRAKYSLPERKFDSWNPVESMNVRKKEIEEHRK